MLSQKRGSFSLPLLAWHVEGNEESTQRETSRQNCPHPAFVAFVGFCATLLRMKRTLRILALAVAAAAALAWLALGANRGWTRTSVPVKIVDEVTGIEGIEYRRQFVPGLEFLGAALLGAGALAGASLFFRHQPTKANES
jgi:hypothetical protein